MGSPPYVIPGNRVVRRVYIMRVVACTPRPAHNLSGFECFARDKTIADCLRFNCNVYTVVAVADVKTRGKIWQDFFNTPFERRRGWRPPCIPVGSRGLDCGGRVCWPCFFIHLRKNRNDPSWPTTLAEDPGLLSCWPISGRKQNCLAFRLNP